MQILRSAIIYLILIAVSATIGFILYMIGSNYEPEPKQTVFNSGTPEILADTNTYTFITWNIGYAGLSANMDFFYDGGKKVRPKRETLEKNLTEIKNILERTPSDFYLLQEVDKNAKRSYGINEFKALQDIFPRSTCTFGKNYDVRFIPVPPKKPLGHVKSGLMTISGYKPKSSVRHSFPGEYSFPKKLFMLNRCFLVNRYPINTNKQLVVVNTHNSAYDNGKLKEKEMEHLREFLLDEYAKGHHIIVGGDWNQMPPGFYPVFSDNKPAKATTKISEDFLPRWNWAFDNSFPTHRDLKAPYKKGETLTRVIDFFLISPNVKVQKVKTINLDFKYTDHQPVKLKISLL